MHKHLSAGLSVGVVRWLTVGVVLALAGTAGACVPREKDAGRVDDLTVGEPKFKEYKGANVYLLRGVDGAVTVFWGVSPLEGGERGRQRCFIQDRRDRTFRGETRPFIDPCHSAWWSSDGRFLGYSRDAEGSPSDGPELIRIGAEVRDGRVHLDEAALRCLQSRTCDGRASGSAAP